ncbi:helix-turn-helix domain-containing protein [Corynebacterium poyangense]|uniref:Helix-turn-helix domain-containing protein n=1 Tax=Corynebacterium poyangense TaxID=2684405 RepID=A0A7H0SLW6_9CORY|nr:helix-turn-helix transcriptional regulator [Corynebacterium poyangense]MBZ8177648.1 helix-turn-helix domain-containing protein [Corynebacterium poyangense]QNQ89541.1 helix-turn-helix domain-containing protein [Corynebacterium poyangense]
MSGPRRKLGKPAGNIPELLALGEQIAECRRSQGRLQNDVAADAGVSRSTLHTIEHGGSGVRWEKIAAVCKALGLTLRLEEN